MKSLCFAASEKYPVAILIKSSAFNQTAIDTNYVTPLVLEGIARDQFVAFSLPYNDADKAPVKHIKNVLDALLPELLDLGVQYLFCCDAAFFKRIAGLQKAEANLGYCLPCRYEGYEHMRVVLGINHTALIYNPINANKLALSIKAMAQAFTGEKPQFDTSIVTQATYPVTTIAIDQELKELHNYPALSCDIETFSLEHDKAGIGTIAFAWNHCEGIAFAVDYSPVADKEGVYGTYTINPQKRQLLRHFFDTYQGQLSFHRANFDIKVLIYTLYMKDLADTEGLLKGLHTLCRDFDDTRIIAYLALNSTAGNELSLKALAHEYAGNYAQESINDITCICLPDLLEYNLVDACCTNWVHEKYYAKLVEDDQEAIYFDLMLPSLKTIIQMELTGMPLNPDRVQEVKHKLEILRTMHEMTIRAHPVVREVEAIITKAEYDEDYRKRCEKAKNPDKIKQRDWDTYPVKHFNPNSNTQLQVLLYDVLKLPVIEKTQTGQPATGADVIKALVHHVTDESVKEFFEALIGFSGVEKILSTFITAFEKAISHSPDDPRVYLHGSFNLGGTVSARLSSSDPNLQNLPSNSQYGKLIKSCFQANKNDLFVGADFNSLEAMVNALTTRDPNKLAVYENGLDSHSWNAFGYWPEKMPDIQAMMDKSELPGKFYKRQLPDGQFEYLHESDL